MKPGMRRGQRNWKAKARDRAARDEERIREQEDKPSPVTRYFFDPKTLKRDK